MAVPPLPAFSKEALAFLRALERNNRREWFHARKDTYQAHLRGPMEAIVARLAVDLAKVAPDQLADVKRSLFRPWRDTRFSSDKKPLKTNIAATFPHHLLGRMNGAGFYFEVSAKYVWIGGGLYAPDAAQLYAVRSHIAEHHEEFGALLRTAAFRKTVGTLTGETISRVPRGFDKAHPAAAWLMHKQWMAAREEAPAFATRPDFYKHLLATFTALAPLVAFLNEPLVALEATRASDPLVKGEAGL
jgi:uncharacterized protein (TIGR02453 family)